MQEALFDELEKIAVSPGWVAQKAFNAGFKHPAGLGSRLDRLGSKKGLTAAQSLKRAIAGGAAVEGRVAGEAAGHGLAKKPIKPSKPLKMEMKMDMVKKSASKMAPSQPFYQGAVQGDEVQMATNASIPANAQDKGNPNWNQKPSGTRMFMSSPAEVKGHGTPARHANNLFGLPFSPIGRINDIRGLRRYDDQSEAKSQDRSQSPIDAQSTANLSQGGAMYPMSGPGGV